MRKLYFILFGLLFILRSSFLSACYCTDITNRWQNSDVFICNPECDEGNCFTSRTFMLTRPVSHNIVAQQSLWHDFLYNKKECIGGSFQIIAYYQQSIRESYTTKYFLPCFKTSLVVLGDDNHDSQHRDIRAEWLGLPSDFRGGMSICPEQRQTGVLLEYSQDLKRFADYDFLKRFWINIALPLVVVENNMNISQFDVFNKGCLNDQPKDLIEAFRQKDWMYAKINGKSSVFSPAPLMIRLGGAFLDDGPNQIISYTSIYIPMGQEDQNRYLFEPVAGYNGHLGFGPGVNFQIGLNRDDKFYDICLFANLEAVFLIRDWHYRTFDLKGRPWSRYLLFNKKFGPPDQNIPGVNVLTRRVKVRPYFMADFSTGLRVKSEKFEFELGYSIWGHGAEKIECVRRFECIWGIAGISQPGDQLARSASVSTICHREATDEENLPEDQDPTFVPVTDVDVDIYSAEGQGALNHRVHVAGGFEKKGTSVDVFFGAGGYYEIPQKNSALKTAGAWFKLGGSF